MHFAASEFGWTYEELMWKVPASVIALMARRKKLEEGKIFPLTVIEEIDDGEKT